MNGNLRRMGRIERNARAQGFSGVKAEKKIQRATAEQELPLVHESCNCSGFTMAVVAAALITFVGIFIYALVV